MGKSEGSSVQTISTVNRKGARLGNSKGPGNLGRKVCRRGKEKEGERKAKTERSKGNNNSGQEGVGVFNRIATNPGEKL